MTEENETPKEPAPVEEKQEATPTSFDQQPIVRQEPKESAGEMIGRANAAAERLEAANAERRKLLQEQERLQVHNMLGGKAEATPVQKEETPEDYAKKVLAGKLDETEKN